MAKELAKKYNHKSVEQGKYQQWLDKKYFEAGDKDKEPFSIVMPPPNITSKLHLGHAWDGAIQDIVARYKRMQGFDMLWLPGMDHAGIATQAKVDAKLRGMGTSRHEIGREAFLEHAWAWKDEHSEQIRNQWAVMGLSVDYSRERFTLDKELNDSVNHVFVKLYEEGIIYRGEKIINWDPQAKTALSNIEVIYKDSESDFFTFKYMVEGSDEFIPVATTRPETMFADVCVAVNKDDERYKHLVGKNVLIPASNKPIPVITDEHADMTLGTGAVKITPAHDPNDFEVSERHNLERPFCMDESAKMNDLCGEYKGMDRFECRDALVKVLEANGLLVKIEKRENSVGYSERTDVMVEPYLSKQWFVKMDNLAKDSLDFQQGDDKINFIPERFEKIFSNWMEGVYDWCISRQLWWGHRIPAWYRGEEVYVGKEAPEGEGWVQDNDVLDTWFSSALWPFSTLGWPNETEDFLRYFPTNFLESGYDIIFFWIARMIFQSLYLTGEKPFKDVMMHGLIRDDEGRKMSKSLGNGVDPIQEIEKFGTDALRFFLTTSSSPGQDLRYIEEKVGASWNFINKIWNSSRFTLMNLGEFSYESIKLENLNLPDRWILTKLDEVIKEVNTNMDKYEFGIVGTALYSFVWDDFCSWYIEMTKMTLQGTDTEIAASKSTLAHVLLSIVKLLHPFMPFVTEEIYQTLPHNEESICISKWPEELNINDDAAKNTMNSMIEIIRNVRTIRQDVEVAMSKPIDLLVKCDSEEVAEKLNANQEYIQKFCNSAKLVISTDVEGTTDAKSAVFDHGQVFIPMADLIDIEEEIAKLEKEEKRLKGEVKRCEGMLSNERFTSKAPADKVQAEKDKLEMYKNQLEAVTVNLKEMRK